MADLAAFSALADRIEAELRRLDAWDATPPSDAALANGGAFGMKTMAYTQWIQWVLLPRLRQVADGSFPVPPNSMVGAHAVREFDGWNESVPLQHLLIEVDQLVARSQ